MLTKTHPNTTIQFIFQQFPDADPGALDQLMTLQVNDLVRLGLLTLMIMTYYYLIGTYFYLDFVGGIVFSTTFDHLFDWFLSGF